jgi:thiol-disulfide isomerase/thioredoxin
MRLLFLLFSLTGSSFLFAQRSSSVDLYRAVLQRPDSLPIVFMLESKMIRGKESWTIRNAEEKLMLKEVRFAGDSIFADMPFFESSFKLVKVSPGKITGHWIKGTTKDDQVMPVVLHTGQKRFELLNGKATANLTGRWKVEFTRPVGTKRPAIAEFKQNGNIITGTFLTPSGDYRFLEGIVTGDSLMMSCFDGSHAYFFGAKIGEDGSLVNGVYAAGPVYRETWTASKDPAAELDGSSTLMYLKDGEDRLNFRFPDIDSNFVSINDERFKNKVVVIQIMGSWCPNCMDETAFLTKYYDLNKNRGVEMVALAYEYSTNFSRGQKSLRKLQKQFDVKYPILITGVTTSDSLRTEKTLPELSPIKVFPSTIFLDRKGRVREVHTGFYGPGTGIHYEEFKKEFESIISRLLAEPGVAVNKIEEQMPANAKTVNHYSR